MDERRLDGNAAAGTLGEVFSFEVTTAEYTCEGCGKTDRIGAAMVYEVRGLGTRLSRWLDFRPPARGADRASRLSGHNLALVPRELLLYEAAQRLQRC
ncbi:MAG: DUF6510 family protein, partial [candidate division NC10 bacterium]|nr:DUF6510 family protein [candidate division NC10 bacterium]